MTTQNLFTVKHQLQYDTRPYNRDEVRKLPENLTGLYAIWLPDGAPGSNEPLYVGMSDTCIRTRLLQHLSKEEPNQELRAELRMFRDSVQFSFTCIQGREEIFGFERAVTKAFQPNTNRMNL